ncbi:MAG: hypothetical protein LBV16_05155 [Elusimicrobiota bacterium]|nr:hypothetical protein [Elusimicrobiota bacterium]
MKSKTENLLELKINMNNEIKMNNKQSQINKTISKYVPVCVSVLKSVSVGADPCVCPHQINFPSLHIPPTPSLPSVPIGNPLSTQSASLFPCP